MITKCNEYQVNTNLYVKFKEITKLRVFSELIQEELILFLIQWVVLTPRRAMIF